MREISSKIGVWALRYCCLGLYCLLERDALMPPRTVVCVGSCSCAVARGLRGCGLVGVFDGGVGLGVEVEASGMRYWEGALRKVEREMVVALSLIHCDRVTLPAVLIHSC